MVTPSLFSREPKFYFVFLLTISPQSVPPRGGALPLMFHSRNTSHGWKAKTPRPSTSTVSSRSFGMWPEETNQKNVGKSQSTISRLWEGCRLLNFFRKLITTTWLIQKLTLSLIHQLQLFLIPVLTTPQNTSTISTRSVNSPSSKNSLFDPSHSDN